MILIIVQARQKLRWKLHLSDSLIEKDNGFTNLTVDPNPNVEVGCAAEKCVYNCSHICTADSINVAGKYAHQAEQTLCATFSEK